MIQAFRKKAEACGEKDALFSLLAGHVRDYPQESLHQILVNFERKTREIPASYRGPILTAVHEEIFCTHHHLLTAAALKADGSVVLPPCGRSMQTTAG